MRDHPIRIPTCFTSDDPSTAVTRSGQSVFQSMYCVKVSNQNRLITITWCKNLMLRGLSVSVSGDHEEDNQYTCKVELKPWSFWRKHGSKKFTLEFGKEDSKSVDVHWDLKNAKFHGETEPVSNYYVAVVHNQEVVLLLGDLKKNAYRKTGFRPALVDPILVSRKEHVFGRKKFVTKVRFHEKDVLHEIAVEYKYKNTKKLDDLNDLSEPEPELDIRVDGHLAVHVKHLHWKFRGNESIHIHKNKVDVFWDVHDWLFSFGLRHALFIFKLCRSSSSPEELDSNGQSEFSLFFHTWKID